ncbi:MAG: hypothetical protein GF350_12625 [Chitinivibrionales bacterium]|nr:hypothetical protein [Chitinivibrionales bacterium]
MNVSILCTTPLLFSAVVSLVQAYTCPDYSDPHSNTEALSPSDNIRSILYSASSGTTYLLETGVYHLETGVELMKVKDVEVYHNTVRAADDPFNCMEYRHSGTTVIMKNNLYSHRTGACVR